MFFPTSPWTLKKLPPHLQLVSWALGTRPKSKKDTAYGFRSPPLDSSPLGHSDWCWFRFDVIRRFVTQDLEPLVCSEPSYFMMIRSFLHSWLCWARFDGLQFQAGRFDHFCLYQNHLEWLSDGVAHNNRNSSLKVLDWPGPFPVRPSHFGAHLRQVDKGWHKAPMNHCLI